MDFAAAGRGEGQRDVDDAADVGLAIVEAVAGNAVTGVALFVPFALINAAHILAHRDDVGGGGDLRADRAGGAKLGQGFERGELAIEIEAGAKLIDKAIAAGAAQHRAARGEQIFAECSDFFGQARAALGFGGKTDQAALMQLECTVAALCEQVEQVHRDRHDLRADALTEQYANVVHRRRIECGTGNAERFAETRAQRLADRKGRDRAGAGGIRH